MNNPNESLLKSINAKLTAILALGLREKPGISKTRVQRSHLQDLAGFLLECGLEDEDIALVLNTTKDSVRMMRYRIKRKR
jgi:hypothetical protein